MNTKQLIALWYTGLAIVALLVFGNGEIPFIKNEWVTLIACVSIIGLLSIYTFKNGHQLDKKKFVRWVSPMIVTPVVIVAIIIAINYKMTEQLPPSELANVQIKRNPKSYDSGDVFADIYNGSSYNISEVVVKITARNSWEDAPDFSAYSVEADKNRKQGKSVFFEYGGQKYEFPVGTTAEVAKSKILDRHKLLWARQYRVQLHIPSLSSGKLFLSITDTKDAILNYEIVEVAGRKVK